MSVRHDHRTTLACQSRAAPTSARRAIFADTSLCRGLLCSTALGSLFAVLAVVTPAFAQTVTISSPEFSDPGTAAPTAAGQTVIDGDTTVTVPGTYTSPWDLTPSPNSQLVIGNATGSSRLHIFETGEVRSSHSYIGFGTGSNGVVTVEGTWTNSYLEVGYRGIGRLDITGGGTVTSSNHSTIGNYSTGIANVDGTNSSWTLSDGLSIGVYHGEGTLNITNGGTVTTTASTTAIAIGNGTNPGESDAKGTVNIDGPGSTLNAIGPSIVGRYGSGFLNITNGGAMSVTAATSGLLVGFEPGSNGTVRVDGAGSKLDILGYLDFGYLGTGSLSVTNGGAVSNLNGYIASNSADATGTVTVDGAGSTWTNNGILHVASLGTATLTITNGGLVTATTRVWLGASVGGNGTINIGAAQGAPAAAPGTLDAPILWFGGGTGRIVFNHTDTSGNYVFAPAMMYGGATRSAVDVYAGTTVMTGASTYFGLTTVYGGMLAAGKANVFSSNSDYVVQGAGGLDLRGNDQTVASLANAGLINMGTGTPPTTVLTVNGDYVGNGGTISLNTFLGADNSPTDMLVVNGSTSGMTNLHVVNAGGFGAQTTGNGIEVIEVNGASNGQFGLTGRVAAGAYDYNLFQNGVSNTDGNWYLRSSLRPEVPVDVATPELVSRMGRAMMGEGSLGQFCLETAAPEQEYAAGKLNGCRSGIWGRVFGETGTWGGSNSTAQLNSNGTLGNGSSAYNFTLGGFQTGADLYRTARDNAGLFAGAGRLDATVRGLDGGNAGRVGMDSYAAGGYWSHHGPGGWYADLLLQGTRYDNVRATTFGGTSISTNGTGFAASGKTGYWIALGGGNFIVPQAQLIYQHTSINGAADAFSLINFGAIDELYARLGVRLTRDWAANSGSMVTTWVDVNVWRQFGDDATTTFASLQGVHSATFASSLGDTWGQLRLGISGDVMRNVSVFGIGDYNVAFNQPGHSLGGHVGAKVHW